MSLPPLRRRQVLQMFFRVDRSMRTSAKVQEKVAKVLAGLVENGGEPVNDSGSC